MSAIKHDRKTEKVVNYVAGTFVHWKGILLGIWGRVTDSQLHELAGRCNKLAGKMRMSCNMNRDEAKKALDSEDEFSIPSKSSTFR